jgi:hypothetical protein
MSLGSNGIYGYPRDRRRQLRNTVAKLLYEEAFARHGCPRKIVMVENKGFVADLLKVCRVKRVEISAYHSQCNCLAEHVMRQLSISVEILQRSAK